MLQKLCRYGDFCEYILPRASETYFDLTKKGRPFLWGKEQQDTFKEMKSRLQKPPVLSMPDRKGRFILYQTPVSLQLAACYISSKMEDPGLLHMQAKECLRQPRTIQSNS